VSGTASFEQAAASWQASESTTVTGTGTFDQEAATWAATGLQAVVEEEVNYGRTVYTKRRWAKAEWEQRVASWGGEGRVAIVGRAAFGRAPATFEARGELRIVGLGSWEQTAVWEGEGLHDEEALALLLAA
jgi:hypothetical protein